MGQVQTSKAKLTRSLTLDRIVGLGRFVNGNVRSVRDGEAITPRNQHQRHAIPARWSHFSIRPPIAAHGPTNDRNNGSAGQRLDAFDLFQFARPVLEQQIEKNT